MFSHHAQLRMQTRGISPDLVESIIMNADTETAVGDNCALLRVSRARARVLNIDDRMGRYGVIWSESTGQVVTVLPIHAGHSGARYRRTN